jgi:hypothetical protein
MKINGRLLLLAVVTGLFMRIWSETGARHGSEHLARGQRPAVSVSQPMSVGESLAQPTPSEPPVTAAIPAFDPSAQPQEWTPQTAPISLPQGLSAGTWRVVDDRGQVARLELPVSDFPIDQLQTEFHVTTIDGQRWYFIRLNSPERIASGRPVLEAACTPAPQPASDESPVVVDAGNPGNPLAGGAVVVVLESVPATGGGPDTPPSDPIGTGDASTELPPVPVLAEPLHSPPALPERQLQAQSEIPGGTPVDPAVETSGGIPNRKFDFEGYAESQSEVASPAADITAAAANPACEPAIPTAADVPVTDPSLADLNPERPAEVDMPEGV